MKNWQPYSLRYYQNVVENLELRTAAQLEIYNAAKETGKNIEEEHKKYVALAHEQFYMRVRRDDKKRVFQRLQPYIDIYGEAPDFFPNGDTARWCQNCHERRDWFDFLKLTPTGWEWLDTCAVCYFEEISARFTYAFNERFENTKHLKVKYRADKQCEFCGEVKPITHFVAKGYNRYELDGDNHHYDYICVECRKQFDHLIRIKGGKVVKRKMPFIYKPNDPNVWTINPYYLAGADDLSIEYTMKLEKIKEAILAKGLQAKDLHAGILRKAMEDKSDESMQMKVCLAILRMLEVDDDVTSQTSQ
jgi:hypothetical protein